MVIVTGWRLKVSLTGGAVGPFVNFVAHQTVTGTADLARIATPMVVLIIVPFLTPVAPVASVQVGGHGRDQVKMVVVIQ